MKHVTVLLREAVESLALRSDSVVVDATYGAGGHAAVIATQLGQHGTLILLDADPTAFSAGTPKTEATLHTSVSNFRHVDTTVRGCGVTKVDAMLADLGWRQDQFTDGGKGFSFSADEPLAMTFGEPTTYPFTAADIVNNWNEAAIADVIYAYGEDRQARRIARAIVTARAKQSIDTAAALATIVAETVRRPGRSKIHPATKTFQALRIAVNDELCALEEFLLSAKHLLVSGGRLSIITFHSIEDRIVKQTFKAWEVAGEAERLTKKPVVPSDAEVKQNPRARSAKLRTIIIR